MKTYKLQVVVFLSFLALFSLIVAGIVVYGYRSNSEIMLQSSDELLYQVSETIIRQTTNHLDPAHKMGELLKNLIEKNTKNFESLVPIIEFVSFEVLKVYPQFSAIYYGDSNGDFVMCRRLLNGNLATKIISNGAMEGHAFEKEMDDEKTLISETIVADHYDPRDRPWYIITRNEGKVTWSREYELFTERVRGVTCAHPIFCDQEGFTGAVGIDFRLNDISDFLRSMKIGDSGTAFILDLEGNVLAYPEQSLVKDSLKSLSLGSKDAVNSPIQHAMQVYLKSRLMRFTFAFGGENYIASFRPFSEKVGRNWVLGIIVPEEDFIGPIARIHETTLLFSFWLLIVAGFLTAAIAKELTDPINELTLEMAKIKELKFEDPINIKSSVTEIQTMANAMGAMKKVLGSFNKYVPSEIVTGLVRTGNEASVQAQAEKITLMFTDIANFSTITEKVDPKDLVQQLSEYFDIIASIIYKHNGVIDKYIGDSVMAFWGAPHEDGAQAQNACIAALEMNKAILDLNQRWRKENKMELVTRIGVNTGVTLVGNFGSSTRFNYTAVGDTVNLASRLEGLNKIYGTKIIVSEDTYKEVKDEFIFRLLDLVTVKGREQSLKIYNLLSETSCENHEKYKKVSRLTEKAFINYLNRDWKKAIELFNDVLTIMPDDFVSKLYIIRSEKLQKHPPDKDWDGVFNIQSK